MFALLFLLILVNSSELSSKKSPNLINYIIIGSEAKPAYYLCQSKAKTIKLALDNGIALENIPSQVITERNVSFLLYTRKNMFEPEILNTYDTNVMVNSSKFIDYSKETVLYVNGANQSYHKSAQQFTTNLLPKQDVNVIIVDWNSYAFFSLDYVRNFTTPRLGAIVGKFGNQLVSSGADARKLYFIGFSVGGQTVGLAAKQITPKIGKILSIDPQGNCFNELPRTEKIDITDASFVQIIHCTVGMKASPLSLRGHVTFFPNGGLIQPQCYQNSTINDMNVCSHVACDTYFFETLKNFNQYVAIECDKYTNYLSKTCNCADTEIMGYNTPTSVRGTYYINTQSSNNLCQYGIKS